MKKLVRYMAWFDFNDDILKNSHLQESLEAYRRSWNCCIEDGIKIPRCKKLSIIVED